MSQVQLAVYEGALQRKVMPGDVVQGGEIYPVTVAGNNLTATGAQITGSILVRTPSANGTDVTPTAGAIISALISQNASPNQGITWRLVVVNLAAFTVGWSAGAGVVLVNANIAASSVKEYLLRVDNASPARTVAFTTINGSPILSNVALVDLQNVSAGMIFADAVAGLQGASIIGVNIAAGTITLNGNANATNTTPVQTSFSPVVSMIGLGQGAL